MELEDGLKDWLGLGYAVGMEGLEEEEEEEELENERGWKTGLPEMQ